MVLISNFYRAGIKCKASSDDTSKPSQNQVDIQVSSLIVIALVVVAVVVEATFPNSGVSTSGLKMTRYPMGRGSNLQVSSYLRRDAAGWERSCMESEEWRVSVVRWCHWSPLPQPPPHSPNAVWLRCGLGRRPSKVPKRSCSRVVAALFDTHQ